MSLARSLLFVLCAIAAVAVRAANPVQLENAKPGTPSWRMSSEAVGQIEGYGSATSVNLGESIRIYVNTTDPTYTMNIYRLGWYDGVGGRLVHGPVQRTGIRQQIPRPDSRTGLIECDWVDPYVLTIPNDWVSGAFVAKLTADASKKDKYVLFVVRDDARRANHNFQLTVTTAQAYNPWGGKSLYPHNSTGEPADKVSFNRPYTDGSGTGNFLWRWEYNMVRFLEREGYDVTYSTNIDTHRDAARLLNYRSFLSVGHDEYWTHEMRANVEAAIAAGVNMGFFSGNNCYWQIRLEPGANGEPHRTIVGYKQDALTKDPLAIDNNRQNDIYVTTKWRDAPVNRPEAAFLGVEYIYNPVDSDVVIDDVTTAPWVFDQTSLTRGSVLPGLLGYEVDAITVNSPRGMVRLAHSPFLDSTLGRTNYSNMAFYVAPSGATVFSTGTIQWSWGLDEWRGTDRTSRLNPAAQQITRNVLRRFAGANEVADCQFSFPARVLAVSAAAGSGTVTVTANSWCAWTATSNASWLRITSAASGMGGSTLTYEFDANTRETRTAVIDVGGNKLTVQQASGCSLTLNPASQSISPEGGVGTIRVNASDPSCQWSAVTRVPWIRFESGTGGAGSGTLRYVVSKNTTGASRDGQILVNGIRFNVHQSRGTTQEPSGKRRRSTRG